MSWRASIKQAMRGAGAASAWGGSPKSSGPSRIQRRTERRQAQGAAELQTTLAGTLPPGFGLPKKTRKHNR